MAISLSAAAARHVTRYLAKRGSGVGVRLGVKTTGCSGLAYVLEYVDNPNLHCVRHYDSNGVRIFVDPKNIPYLDGMIIDLKRNGLNEGFEFINKNERDRCGCGESFRI